MGGRIPSRNLSWSAAMHDVPPPDAALVCRRLKSLPLPPEVDRESVCRVFLSRLWKSWRDCAHMCYHDRALFFKRAEIAIERAWRKVRATDDVKSFVGLLYHLVFEHKYGRPFLLEVMDDRERLPPVPGAYTPATVRGVLAEGRRAEARSKLARLLAWMREHPGERVPRGLALRLAVECRRARPR